MVDAAQRLTPQAYNDMHHIPPAERARWQRLSDRRGRRRRQERIKRKDRRRAKHPVYADCLTLKAPRVFSVSNRHHRAELLRFLRALRHRTLAVGGALRIDFSGTKQMVSCGTLLFVAELDRIIRITTRKVRITMRRPKDKIVGQVLHQVGVISLLGARPYQQDEFADNVKHWHYATSVHAVADDFDRVLDECDGKITPALSKSIYKGVTEAMTNCAQHAYLEPREDGYRISDERRWWMFSEELDDKLHVAFCDLGMGIPRSLPRIGDETAVGWMEMLRGFLQGFTQDKHEAALIKAALEIGKSRTKEPHRGLGLKQIVDTVALAPGSSVLIFSNRGAYELIPDRRIRERLIQFDDSIMGTLIQWSMPLHHREDNEHGADRDN